MKPQQEAPPLPPPSQPPPEEQEQEQEQEKVGEWLEQKLICFSDQAGKLRFGVSGKATCFTQGRYSLLTASGTFLIPEEWLCLLNSRPDTAAFVWPNFRQLAKSEVRGMLSSLACSPVLVLSIMEFPAHDLIQFPDHKEPLLVEDQWLWAGWHMLRWGLLKSTKQVPEHFSITCACVDPAVPAFLKEFPLRCLRNGLRT